MGEIIICGMNRKIAESVAKKVEDKYGVKPLIVAPKKGNDKSE